MLPYLFKLSIAVMVVFLFYQFVLRRLTFYTWNRWYLLFYSGLCFLIPFIDINPLLQRNQLDANELVVLIPLVSRAGFSHTSQPIVGWGIQDWLTLLLFSGSFIIAIRLLVQHVSLWRLRRAARLIVDDKIRLYQVDKSIIPFSFGNSIFVNQSQHTEQELQEIIRHEFIHVKQHHTFDILFAELFCVLNWYNPFAWLIRNAIRQNLEFIADREVLQKGIDKKEYQYLLLKVIGVSQFSIATKFNFTSLKKRIAMMNKMRTAKVHLLKFLFLLPVLLVLLVSFRKQLITSVDASQLFAQQDTIPSSKKGVNKLPEQVKSIKVQNDLITVLRKDGSKEVYDQRKPEEMTAFEKKYGALPPPPPPPLRPSAPSHKAPAPPPPPAAPPSGVSAHSSPDVPAAPALPTKEDWVKATVNKKGYILSVADNNGECVVIIKNKLGKIERSMLLTDWTNNEKANEARYGVLPPPPAKAPRIDMINQGAIPAPGADAGIINAPAEGYYIKADKIEYTPGAKENNETLRMSSSRGVTIKGQTNALIVIDGIVQDGQDALNRLDPDQISQIDVLKNESATTLYGERGKNGVLLITTKKDASSQPLKKVNHPASGSDAGNTAISRTDVVNTGNENVAFYVLDGKEYSADAYKKLNIQSTDIKSIHVWKGAAAVKLFGERARVGVIEVKTK